MKSVSFSDLRESPFMSSTDSSVRLSSSNKQLTYYSSSEDILRRFSSKKSDKFSLKEQKPIDERNNEMSMTLSDSLINSFEESKPDYETTTTAERTIKELREQLTQKNNIIANLQDENLLLQNESTKNSEQVKFLENRIKYLEHALASFTSNIQEKNQQNNSTNDISDKENMKKFNPPQNSVKAKPFGSRMNSDVESPGDETKNSSYFFNKTRYGNENTSCQEKSIDLKKRPSSADSTLQNNNTTTGNIYEEDLYNQTRQSSMKLYDSDSEPNKSYKNSHSHSNNVNQKPIPTSYIEFQRQKLDRDRTMNLTEFKSRLDEFTKYAQKSAEQNCLRSSTSSLTQNNDYKQPSKYYSSQDKWTEQNNKSRLKSTYHGSRPPIDPYHKQRKSNNYEIKVSNESLTNYSSSSQNAADEDVILKERVKKLLEKHNYPIGNSHYSSSNDHSYDTTSNNIAYRDDYTNANSYKPSRSKDNLRLSDWRNLSSPTQYGVTVNGSTKYNDPSVPRLDLSLNTAGAQYSGDTSDLLEKYLNYQGYTNVL